MTPAPATAVLRAEDHVLFGTRGEAKPREWRIGRVVNARGDTVVVETEDDERPRVRLISPADVIVVSRSVQWLQALTIARQMIELKVTRELDEVRICERRLVAAREALWAAIDATLGIRAPLIDGSESHVPTSGGTS